MCDAELIFSGWKQFTFEALHSDFEISQQLWKGKRGRDGGISIGSFSKPRRRRQRECRQTKGLMSKTIAVHVRFESLHISLPSSAKQQREMIKFYVFWRTRTTTANFGIFFWKWSLSVHVWPEQIFRPIGVLNRFTESRNSKAEYKFIFSRRQTSVAVVIAKTP